MLFIYGNLPIGGIETFYIRMAKARSKRGLKTKFLFLADEAKCELDILDDLRKYSEVFFIKDFLKRSFFSEFTSYFWLLKSLNYKRLNLLFCDVRHVHAAESVYAMFFYKINQKLNLNCILTVGVYHSREYIWEYNNKIPYYEKINRKLFSSLMQNNQVFFFDQRTPVKYCQYYEVDINLVDKERIFPIGVLDKEINFSKNLRSCDGLIKICSVGRLVDFKSYNLWMLKIINKITEMVDVQYDIYGSGPLQDEMMKIIKEEGVSDRVTLKGDLPYSTFDQVVLEYDLFVGSGTAIIESAKLGVPSIVGIESNPEPTTYGFICDVDGFSYNEDFLYEKKNFLDFLSKYLEMSCLEKKELGSRHRNWANKFSMDICVENFDRVLYSNNTKNIDIGYFSSFAYACSFFLFSRVLKLKNLSFLKVIYG